MKVALLPSNQVSNATAIRGKSESDLQLPIATAAANVLRASGIDAQVFHLLEGWTSNDYPKFPKLYEMCRMAAKFDADYVILNHSDACGSKPAGLLSLADSGLRYQSEYINWTRKFHDILGRLNGRGHKLWTLDKDYMGFRYGFYSYLDDFDWKGAQGYPLIIELANHENFEDATWLLTNASQIGKNIATAFMQSVGYAGDEDMPIDAVTESTYKPHLEKLVSLGIINKPEAHPAGDAVSNGLLWTVIGRLLEKIESFPNR